MAAAKTTPTIYVSSGGGPELEPCRLAVVQVLETLGIVAERTDWSRANWPLIDRLRERISNSSAYTGLIGHRYGVGPSRDLNREGHSYDELEFAQADLAGIPIFMFLASEKFHRPRMGDALTSGEAKRLEAFRRRVTSRLAVIYFDSLKDLRSKAMQQFTRFRSRDELRHTQLVELEANFSWAGIAAISGIEKARAQRLVVERLRNVVLRFEGEYNSEVAPALHARFHTGGDAVRCAVAIQQELRVLDHSAGVRLPESSKILATVFVQLFESGSGLPQPRWRSFPEFSGDEVGGVLVSRKVRDLVESILPYEFRLLGSTARHGDVFEVIYEPEGTVGSVPLEAPLPKPPEAALPSLSPATRFAVREGRIDVLPFEAWLDGKRVAEYHTRAHLVATQLAERLANSDAEPKLASAISAVLDVLGSDAAHLQPDQVRLASRSIGARARAYGHPSAAGEISVESVGLLFELSDVLVDLQAFAVDELTKHERAIRQLGLSATDVVEVKRALDELAELVTVSPEIVTERVSIAVAAETRASDSASDEGVQRDIEGGRLLLAENLAIAVARHLSQAKEDAPVAQGSLDAVQEKADVVPTGSPGKRPGRSGTGRKLASPKSPPEWSDFKERLLERIHRKGPDKIADATLDAVSSVIKHAPKSIPTLGAAIVAVVMGNPVLAISGGLGLTVAWVAYDIWRRKRGSGAKGPPRT
jgi:hypothetical protein